MANQSNARRRAPAVAVPFEEARDELFQAIMRCGVAGSTVEHQEEWFSETMAYFAERFPELTEAQMDELRVLGGRFAQPPKSATTPTGAASAA
ncbi:MAG: hypothetical protein NVS4B3_15300 [Gemmatimonadaceae bacterium]